MQEEEADCIKKGRSKGVQLKSNRVHSWAIGVGVRKFSGATTEKLPLEHEEVHGGRQEKRENTYRGRNELKRCPVVSYGGDAAALRQEWRGGAACVASGACPVEGGAFGAPACEDSKAMAQKEGGKRKKRRKAELPVFITGTHPRQLPGLNVPDFPRDVVKTAAVTATRSIVRPLLPSKRSNRTASQATRSDRKSVV